MRRFPVSAALVLACLLTACNSDEKQLLGRAEARWRDGDYDDAIRLNTLLYEKDHQGTYAAHALLNIANIYYLNQRKLRDAIKAYEKLIDEQPGKPEERTAREQLAKIFENEIGDLTAAIMQYDKLLDMNGLDNRGTILFQRANAYFKKEDFNRALREFQRLEEEGISGHLAHQVYLKIGAIYQIQRKYDDSLGYFKRVSEAPCPECRRQAILDMTESYESLYNLDRAIETVQKLDPSPENQKLIEQEVARLQRKRKELDPQPSLSWRSHR